MSIVSIEFLFFCVIIATVYFILPAKLQWAWLLIASVYFYYSNSAWYQGVNLLVFLIINYIMSQIISRQTKRRKAVYVCTLVFDILYLLTFKYFSFLMKIFLLIGMDANKLGTAKAYLSELAPVGISYIAIIVIGYMTDLYWENVTLQKNPGKFVLFSCFFPLTISGPLVKYKEMDENLWGEKHKFDYERIVSGIERVLWGVFKKLVISSRAGIVAGSIYDGYEVYTGLYIPVGIIFYIIQLYADFSGLMDIVIGVSEILGITMPENFNAPFYSESMSEFWRRWHMTLGRFLKDYVLFPMQMSGWFRKLRKAYKNKVGKDFEKKYNIPRYLTMLISWFIIGFWHGGGLNYIFGVGIYMWIVIVLGEALTPLFDKINKLLHINTDCFSWHLFRRVRTILLYMFGVSFFWATTFRDGIGLWKSAFSQFNPWIFVDKSLYNLGLSKDEMLIMLFGVSLMILVSFINKKEGFRAVLNKQNYLFRVCIYAALFALTVMWGYYGTGFEASSFIYGRF